MHVNKGLTLTELITALVILGIAGTMFYTVFFSNWLGFESELARVELQYQLDEIRMRFATNVLGASSSAVLAANSQVMISYPDPDGLGPLVPPPDVNYTFIQPNILQRERQGVTQILSQNIDFSGNCPQFCNVGCAQPHFCQDRGSVVMNLFLADNILGRRINLNTAIQVFPRRSR